LYFLNLTTKQRRRKMFLLIVIIFGFGLIGSVCWFIAEENQRKYSSICAVLCLIFVIGSFFTASGEIYKTRLFSGTVKGSWLIIDQNGGKVMRHWVIEKTYPKDADNSDGTQFMGKDGLVSVGTGATIIQITEPFNNFLKTYKLKYGIPEEQIALE